MAESIQNDPLIADLVRRLRGEFDPCTIYLFGSRATGEARKDSDFDVTVVIPDCEETQFRRFQRARRAIRGIDAAVDVFVYTETEWANYSTKRYSIAGEARCKGVLLHAA